MYYVVPKGRTITEYHATFHKQSEAREYAESLKETFHKNYDIIKMETVWTTQTLDEAMRKAG